MQFEEICTLIKTELSVDFQVNENQLQPTMTVLADDLVKIATFLKQNNALFFDQLSCLTAIDNGLEANTFELIYHFTSILREHQFIIKVFVPRTIDVLPSVDSLASIWKTADWHEREAYDLMGIHFNNHPDLRRILLPADWIGYPLRKDYVEAEIYHGLKIK